MSTTPLLPFPDELEITSISETEQELQVRITSNRSSSRCPLCSTPSYTIHSYYRRKPLELPRVGKTVRLLLCVKKFFCRVASGPRKIFTDRLPELTRAILPTHHSSARHRASDLCSIQCQGRCPPGKTTRHSPLQKDVSAFLAPHVDSTCGQSEGSWDC